MHRFHIPAMTCGGCIRSITRALQALDPESRIEADLAAKELRFSGTASTETVRAALAEAGYPATLR